MNNLSSYCGLVDEKISASDKDLPLLRPASTPYAPVSKRPSVKELIAKLVNKKRAALDLL